MDILSPFRWHQLEELERDRHNLAVHALLAAAFINFLSCAAEDERKKSFSRWLAQLHSQATRNIEMGKEPEKAVFSLKSFLTSEQELMLWRSEGLASDQSFHCFSTNSGGVAILFS